MKRCAKCSFTVHMSDDVFCYSCGEVLVSLPTCNCGYEFGLIDNFCPHCGEEKPESSSNTLLGDDIGSNRE